MKHVTCWPKPVSYDCVVARQCSPCEVISSCNGGFFAQCTRDDMWTNINALWDLQSTSGGELSALMPSILDKAFKGEL